MAEKSELVTALVKAQGDMGGAKKDSTNPHFKSSYADLESVTLAIRPVAKENGLAYIQKFHDCENGVAVETIILHESGEQLSNGILRIPASKQDAQGYGSAVTYARRYSLMAAFGLCPEDDDGNAASKSPPPKPMVKPYGDKPEPVITDAQVGIIKDMVADTASNVDDFLKFCGCKTFETIPAKMYSKAMAALEKKKGEAKP